MKKLLIFLTFAVVLFFASCQGLNSFDQTHLYENGGHWRVSRTIAGGSHEIHQRFLEGGSGREWDVTEDVRENEASGFSWSLKGNTLTLSHSVPMAGGAEIAQESFTVLSLSASSMQIKDKVDKKIYNYSKVAN